MEGPLYQEFHTLYMEGPLCQEFNKFYIEGECSTSICPAQTPCVKLWWNISAYYNNWEVCKEIVNNQRSCQGCSVQASAPTRRQKLKNKAVLNLKQYCMHCYVTLSILINVHEDQSLLTAPTMEWPMGQGS